MSCTRSQIRLWLGSCQTNFKEICHWSVKNWPFQCNFVLKRCLLLLLSFRFFIFLILFSLFWRNFWLFSFWRFECSLCCFLLLFDKLFILFLRFFRWNILTCTKILGLVWITDTFSVKLFSTFLEMFKFLFISWVSLFLPLSLFIFNKLFLYLFITIKFFNHSDQWNYELVPLLWEMSLNFKIRKQIGAEFNHRFYIIYTNFRMSLFEKVLFFKDFNKLYNQSEHVINFHYLSF